MSAKGALIVARRLDGGLAKGHAVSFEPGAEVALEAERGRAEVRIPAADLKAVFFVKDLEGDPRHEDSRSYRDSQPLGRRVWIRFRDGEEIAGWSLSYRRGCEGFYVFPTDQDSNIEMAWVYSHAVRSVLTDNAAEIASREWETRVRGRQFGRIAPEDWDRFLDEAR